MKIFLGIVIIIIFVVLYKLWKIRIFSSIAKKILADSILEQKTQVSEIFKNQYGHYPSIEERDAFMEESQKLVFSQIIESNRFIHIPSGPETILIPKYFASREIAKTTIKPYLENFEIYIWDGVYSTRDPRLAAKESGTSSGRLYVTSHRLLFWPDDSTKLYRAVYWLDIDKCKKLRTPMNMVTFEIYSGNRKAHFGTTKFVARQITPFLSHIPKILGWG